MTELTPEQLDRLGALILKANEGDVDSRGGSSSTFVFDALLTPEEALAAAREAFPPVFARFEFEVRLCPS